MKCTASIKKGQGSLAHNDRSIKNISEKNRSWDSEKSDQNVIYKNENLKKIYEELFEESLKKYNEKQVEKGHQERQIKNYYEKISRSKQEKLFYEIIVQIGNTDSIEKGSADEDKAKKVLHEFCSDFEKRNPNFKVVQMIEHNDEEMISHVHIDFVPFSTNNKRGLDVKNSLTGAFKEMGYTRTRDGFNQWRQNEEKELAKVMKKYGLEFEHADSHFDGVSINEVKEKKKAYVREAQKELSKINVPEKKVDENFFTKKRTVTLNENEYDDLMKKHVLEIEKLKKEKEIEKLNKEKLRKQVQDLKEKPYAELNEQLETQNRTLEESNAKLTDEKKELENKIIELETKNLEIDRLKNDNFKLTQTNIKLRNQHDEDMSYLERLLARLWSFVKGLSQIIPSVENHVLERFNDDEIEDLENNLAMFQPKEKEREIDY